MVLKFNKINNDASKNFLNKFHTFYLDRIQNFYNAQSEQLTRFSWSGNKKVMIYGIEVYDDNSIGHKANIVFATVARKENKLLFSNAIGVTKNPEFSKLLGTRKQLDWLINKEFIPKKLAANIINGSLNTGYGEFGNFGDYITEALANKWVDNEYKETLEIESKSVPITTFPLSKQKYFIDRYQFDDMLETINNTQFTDEFNQCLWAYDQQKWFLCASGLGSCLEHLMLIILQNYAHNGYKTLNGLGFHPTFEKYVERFRKEPINISSRQETYLRIVFMARNAIDHFNTGNTSKELCDLMLNGVSSIFNDYFKKSLENNK